MLYVTFQDPLDWVFECEQCGVLNRDFHYIEVHILRHLEHRRLLCLRSHESESNYYVYSYVVLETPPCQASCRFPSNLRI